MSAVSRAANLVLVVFASFLLPRQLSDDGPPSNLAGQVMLLEGGTARPLPNATVVLARDGVPDRTADTDQNGQFEFEKPEAGLVYLRAEKPGFVSADSNARFSGGVLPVQVRPDTEITSVELRMQRGGVIEGVLFNAFNRPMGGAQVSLLRAHLLGRQPARRAERALITDDTGAFRFFGLLSGEYVISATQATFSGGISIVEKNASGDTVVAVAYAPTLFPGTTEVAQALAIQIQPGEEQRGRDFAMRLVPAMSVSGVLLDKTGARTKEGTVTLSSLQPSLQPGIFRSTIPLTGDGQFRTEGLTPGQYRLVARNGDLRAQYEFILSTSSLAGVTLKLGAGGQVSGRVVREDGPGVSGVRLVFRRATGGGPTGSVDVGNATVAEDGSFLVGGLLPGSYDLELVLPPSLKDTHFLKTATSAGKDVADRGISLVGSSTPEVIFTIARAGQVLSGVVRNADGSAGVGYSVLALSTDPTLWGKVGRRVQLTRVSSNGAYAFSGLASGNYVVAVVLARDLNQVWDDFDLTSIAKHGTAVTLAEGRSQGLDLLIRR